MRFYKYMSTLIENDSGHSSKSFALIVSVIISFLFGLVICFAIAYDVVTNGYIKTDLEEVGVFMLCVGSYVVGSGVPKIFGDRDVEKTKRLKYEVDAEEEEQDKSTSSNKKG